MVQCVPTRKGHLILFKGYTYVFKSRLQCGAEQWCCSFRQKTDNDQYQEWISIYFMKISEKEQQCSICDDVLQAEQKSVSLFEHIKDQHRDVYKLHKNNDDGNVEFQIAILQVYDDDGNSKTEQILLGDIQTEGTEIVEKIPEVEEEKCSEVEDTIVVSQKKPKAKRRDSSSEKRKRSWVYKYFQKISNIMFRCKVCSVVMSIKSCNTNNMNRHVRSKHHSIYLFETAKDPEDPDAEMDQTLLKADEKTEGHLISGNHHHPWISATPEELLICCLPFKEGSPQNRRLSWVWTHFNRVSPTHAQCKICLKNIAHSGYATGNLNRHIKMIHNVVYKKNVTEVVKRKNESDTAWIWKVFDNDNNDFYSCKICQFQCLKFDDDTKVVDCILDHLQREHGVISGNQIITGVDVD